jgi:hypothetical protein
MIARGESVRRINLARPTMRIGLILAIVAAIVIATILWNRGKPPVP